MSKFSSILLACSVAFAACGGGDSIGIAENCNPVGDGSHCMTPWPSSAFEVVDESTISGMRVDLPLGTLPTNIDGLVISPDWMNKRDGFSAAAPMIISFTVGVDGSNLVDYRHYGDSLTDTSPTVLINMTTGERVAHFSELDSRATSDPSDQAMYIRPAKKLDGGTRYAVAIRKSLKAKDGAELPISEGFQAILDGSDSGHPLLEKTRPGYDAIFAALAAEGINKEDLVVAWDFTTASSKSMQIDMLTARDTALPIIGTAGENLTFTVDKSEPSSDPNIALRIEGSFDAPLFLSQDGVYKPGTILVRDPTTNLPVYQKIYRAPFVATIPECALLPENQPVGMMIYGHGLLGTGGQVASGAIRDTTSSLCMVGIGTDLRGMSEPDLVAVIRTLNDLNQSEEMFGTLVQGLVNHIALEHIIRGPMAKDLFVDGTGKSIVDTSQVVYYGLSQGHIFGSSFVAYDPFITRAVVGVGGANYSMMLERSIDWPIYEVVLRGAYQTQLNLALMINLMQHGWDLTDPVSTAADMLRGTIPGTPEKQVLMHMAMGDDQVPNISTEYQARTMGVTVMTPSMKEPWGLETAASGMKSALIIFDGGFNPTPLENIAPTGNEPAHSLTRKTAASLRQMKAFYTTGEVILACGPNGCTCADGGCD